MSDSITWVGMDGHKERIHAVAVSGAGLRTDHCSCGQTRAYQHDHRRLSKRDASRNCLIWTGSTSTTVPTFRNLPNSRHRHETIGAAMASERNWGPAWNGRERIAA